MYVQENVNSGGSADDLCVDNGPNRGSTSIRFRVTSDFFHDILISSYPHIVENKKAKDFLSLVVLNEEDYKLKIREKIKNINFINHGQSQ